MRTRDIAHMSMLYDFYGSLLTSKQRQVLDLYDQMDMSLGEIAENAEVSRQAVHDIVRRATTALEHYEAQLGLVARYQERRGRLEALGRAVTALRRTAVERARAGLPAGAAADGAGAADSAGTDAVVAAAMRVERLVYELLEE